MEVVLDLCKELDKPHVCGKRVERIIKTRREDKSFG